MERASVNGGFPLPPESEPVRLVAAHHDACDGDTRVRLPRAVPSRAVRRVVCDRCAQPYEPPTVEEASASPARRTISWRWLSLPVAGVAVLAVLSAIQGGDESQSPPVTPQSPAAAATDGPDAPARTKGQAKVPTDAQLISESTFQLALPPGWERSAPSGGATFAAVAPDGSADVMLWIERDPKLDFAAFEARSLTQLESIAGSSGVVRRNPGPTPETTTSVIAPTDAPDGAPNYEVLLSGGPGNHWYYLATTSQPGATGEATKGVELVQGSFLPQGGAG